MKYLLRGFLALNIFAFLGNNLAVMAGYFPRESFPLGANVVVILSLYVTLHLHIKPSGVAWFGRLLGETHPANLIVSQAFSMITILPSFFFCSYPLLKHLFP